MDSFALKPPGSTLARLTAATGLMALAITARAAPQAGDAGAKPANAIVLLGTRGGPVIDPRRSEPASLLVVGGVPYLIDAGEGTPRQIVAAGYKLADIHQIFITHHHLDHTAGLEPLMSLTWINRGLVQDASAPVNIYGPPSTTFLVDAALRYLSVSEHIFRAGIPGLPVSTLFRGHDVDPGPVYSDGRIKVTAVANTHFGHASTGPEGKEDASYAYRFDTAAGSVVFTGDTGPSDAVAKLAAGADVLVSEVYQPNPRAASASADPRPAGLAEHMSQEHLTPAEVGKLAAQAHVKRVVLTHIATSPAPGLEETLRQGVALFYKGPVTVGHDLLTIDLAPTAAAASGRP